MFLEFIDSGTVDSPKSLKVVRTHLVLVSGKFELQKSLFRLCDGVPGVRHRLRRIPGPLRAGQLVQ